MILSHRRTTPFTGPRQTTSYFKTAQSAAPCATVCYALVVAASKCRFHHPELETLIRIECLAAVSIGEDVGQMLIAAPLAR